MSARLRLAKLERAGDDTNSELGAAGAKGLTIGPCGTPSRGPTTGPCGTPDKVLGRDKLRATGPAY